jgi:hypothetical protein
VWYRYSWAAVGNRLARRQSDWGLKGQLKREWEYIGQPVRGRGTLEFVYFGRKISWTSWYFDWGSWLYLWWQDERRAWKGLFGGKAQRKNGTLEKDFVHRLSPWVQHFHIRNGQQVQVCQWKGKARNLVRKAPKIAISSRIRVAGNEKDQAPGPVIKESIKSINKSSSIRRATKSWLEVRLQSRPGAGGRLFSWMDEQSRRAQTDAWKNNKEVDQTVIIKIKERAHSEGGKEVLDQHDPSVAWENVQGMEGAG